jgi:hypothetical protein
MPPATWHFYTALNSLLALHKDATARGDTQARRYYAVAVHALLGPSRAFIHEDDDEIVPSMPPSNGPVTCINGDIIRNR